MSRVASIDCGTNSIRLLVADLPADGIGDLTDIDRRMEIVRLGQGVDRTGRLAPEAIERTRVALDRYAGRIRELGAERVRMVATSATRDASNAGEFRDMVRATLGVPPEVITGRQEAELSFTGAVRGLPVGGYVVVDIGGGSTEFVAGTTTVESAISVDIGCVRMTERHLSGNPPTPEQIEAATADIETAVDKALSVVGGMGDATLVGVAGTVTTIAAITLGLSEYQPERIHHSRMSTADIERVVADLLAMTYEQRSALPVMHPGRADVIGAGGLILRTILNRAGVTELVASEHDILDGIAWSLA
ncbi:Ppx/GppA phosphatase family protein [Rugosimonospora africana]|uniref:Hydrolase n=1 Tax=Rugosimonospora africana TaxID=556532 RepID=A0A8J3QJF3_9ACTN|nr:Ppx/GppA phosphatase family protein [Rugosimonospora africana]GIH12104.1 hydrolase [Rugosimonospora africana]